MKLFPLTIPHTMFVRARAAVWHTTGGSHFFTQVERVREVNDVG